MMGHCYCADCRKASGSGFIPFMSFRREVIRFTGESGTFTSKSRSGSDAHRNSCPVCASLVFGGERERSDCFTIYAGSLDNPSVFKPQMAIFTRGRPAWAVIPEGIESFESLPPARSASRP